MDRRRLVLCAVWWTIAAVACWTAVALWTRDRPLIGRTPWHVLPEEEVPRLPYPVRHEVQAFRERELGWRVWRAFEAMPVDDVTVGVRPLCNYGVRSQPRTPVEVGKILYQRLCACCHAIHGATVGRQMAGMLGSTVTLESGETVVVDEPWLRAYLWTDTSHRRYGCDQLEPEEGDHDALIAFYRSLAAPEDRGCHTPSGGAASVDDGPPGGERRP